MPFQDEDDEELYQDEEWREKQREIFYARCKNICSNNKKSEE